MKYLKTFDQFINENYNKVESTEELVDTKTTNETKAEEVEETETEEVEETETEEVEEVEEAEETEDVNEAFKSKENEDFAKEISFISKGVFTKDLPALAKKYGFSVFKTSARGNTEYSIEGVDSENKRYSIIDLYVWSVMGNTKYKIIGNAYSNPIINGAEFNNKMPFKAKDSEKKDVADNVISNWQFLAQSSDTMSKDDVDSYKLWVDIVLKGTEANLKYAKDLGLTKS